MLTELSPEDFPRIEPLLTDLDYLKGFLKIILMGNHNARIWVDSAFKPASALIWDTRYAFVIAGSTDVPGFNTELENLFTKIIAPDALQRGFEQVWLMCSGRWAEQLFNNGNFIEISLKKYPRQYYVLTQSPRKNWKKLIPDEVSLKSVDSDFFKLKDLKNHNTIIDMLNLQWRSLDDFYQLGFGFCLVKEDTILSWCLSEFNAEDICDIEIETVEEYQQKGFATLVALAFLEEAFSRGYKEVGWHTFTQNIPSVRTAQKLGFSVEKEYFSYVWTHNK